MEVRWTEKAAADLEDILQYVARDSPRAARAIRERVSQCCNRIGEFPFLGRETDDPVIRRISITPYPYLLFYEAAREAVIVHGVYHGARDPGSMPGGKATAD